MKTPRLFGAFSFLVRGQIGFDAADHTLHVVDTQTWNEIFSAFGAGLSMEFVEALEADGVDHVALHPQLFVAIGLKWIGAQ